MVVVVIFLFVVLAIVVARAVVGDVVALAKQFIQGTLMKTALLPGMPVQKQFTQSNSSLVMPCVLERLPLTGS